MDELAEKRTPMRVSAETARRIAATDHAALTKSRQSRAVTGRPPEVPAKARIAIQHLLDGKDLQAAA